VGGTYNTSPTPYNVADFPLHAHTGCAKKNATQRKWYIFYNFYARLKLKAVLESQDMYLNPQKKSG